MTSKEATNAFFCGLAASIVVCGPHWSANAAGQTQPDLTRIITEIAAHEDVVEHRRSKLKVTIPEFNVVWYEADWRYSEGREYVGGMRQSLMNAGQEGEAWIWQKYAYAFDGQVMHTYINDPRKPRDAGRISGLEPDGFVGCPTLNTLLGWGIHMSGRLSVSQGLSQAESLRLHDVTDLIDGHQCYVIDAQGVGKGEMRFDVRVWIDPERDYRILKIEHYISDPEARWKRLYRRVDNIKLQEVNGAWMPVSGEFHGFNAVEEPEEGLTVEEVLAMGPEEGRKHTRWRLEPIVPTRVIEIDPESIVFGKEIPVEEFRVNWPVGTDIWDDFLQVAYKIGAGGDKGGVDAFLQKQAAESIGDVVPPATADAGIAPKGKQSAPPAGADAPAETRRTQRLWVIVLMFGALATSLIALLICILARARK